MAQSGFQTCIFESRSIDPFPTGAPYATNGAWLNLLADMHKAFRLAFPAEGACYPDALIRAFDQVAEWYRDLAHNPSFEE